VPRVRGAGTGSGPALFISTTLTALTLFALAFGSATLVAAAALNLVIGFAAFLCHSSSARETHLSNECACARRSITVTSARKPGRQAALRRAYAWLGNGTCVEG
jgi:hypothetical protein